MGHMKVLGDLEIWGCILLLHSEAILLFNSDGRVYTMGAVATVRGVPDWIWLSGQQGWARQMRTWCPDCVWVCVCPQLECEQYRECISSVSMGKWWKRESLWTLCFVWLYSVSFESMRMWWSIWSCVWEKCGGGTHALSQSEKNKKALLCIRKACVVCLSMFYMICRKNV